MANDSTELTFVRCPSCRSLVPAMSSRCRMCGATLDSVGKPQSAAPSENTKSGRVRQRTMSGPGEPLAEEVAEEGSAPKQITEPALEPGKSNRDFSAEQSADMALDDPLQAFVEEVPIENLEPSNGESHGGHSAPSRPAPSRQTKEEIERPQVVVEHGRAKQGGLSFSKPASAEAPDELQPRREPSKELAKERPVEERKPEPRREERREERRPEQRAGGREQEREGRRAEGREEKQARNNNPATDALRALQDLESQREARERPTPEREKEKRRDEQPAAQRPPRPQDLGRSERVRSEAPTLKQDGRLFGWLVSYEHPNGLATELREGRFFICGSRFKEQDLIIDHPSIGTPHALARISIEHGFEVQDLMSDGGVYVKRKDSESFKREDDRVRLGHGDWVKFGDVEFLVSLVAHVGKR